MISGVWHIQMLGGLQAQQADHILTRFRTHQVAALLARLTLFPHRSHAREELVDLLWPDQDVVAGRNRLRVTLSSLRCQLEPPGIAPYSLLMADRSSIKINAGAITTDIHQFLNTLAAADRAADAQKQAELRDQAVALYRGELLPGFYEEWVETERQILAGKYNETLQRLTRFWESQEEYAHALSYACRAAADPYHEATHQDVIRLYLKMGQPIAARQHYQDFQQRLRDELETEPSAVTRALLESSADYPGRSASTVFPARLFSTSSLRFSDASDVPVRSSVPFTLSDAPLPLPLTRFFGRYTELTRLTEMLSSESASQGSGNSVLVTLTGPGGSGKTRLAHEIARSHQSHFPGGAWFVPLAGLTEAGQILPAIQTLLGITSLPPLHLLTAITEALGQRPTLLVLDNMEHLPGGADVVQALREQGAGLTCLVTSRRPLGLPGEREFPVLPLPTPIAGDGILSESISPEHLMTIPSVQLFVDRAQSVRPDFVVTRRNANDVAALCRQLEGIPLAVELAAARVRALSVAQMRERLTERWELLVNPRADKGARHRSLRAALEWSYQLLPEVQKHLLSELSVFRRGWTLEAAEAVCPAPSLLIALEGLRLDSLVLLEGETQESETTVRFRMLETVREFAAAQLSQEEQEDLSRRHALYFLSFVERADLAGQNRRIWAELLGAEIDNFRVALDWCGKAPDPNDVALGLRLCIALTPYWQTQGGTREGYQALCLLLDRKSISNVPAERARVWAQGKLCAGILDCRFGEAEAAEEHLIQALSEFRSLDDTKGIADALHTLGVSLGERQPEKACEYYAQSLAIREILGNKRDIAATLNNLAVIRGEDPDRVAMVLQAQSLFREMNDLEGIAGTYHTLALLYDMQGDPVAAQAAVQSSAALFDQIGEKLGMALTLTQSGLFFWQKGDVAGAKAAMREGLVSIYELGYSQCVASALTAICKMIEVPDPLGAARLSGAVARLLTRLSSQPPVPPVSTGRTEWELGWAMSLEQAVQDALRVLDAL